METSPRAGVTAPHVGIATIVGRTFALFGRGLPSLALLAALVTGSIWLLAVLAEAVGFQKTGAADVVSPAVWALLMLFAAAAVTDLAAGALRGERASLAAALRRAAGRFVPVAIAAALSGAAVLAGLAVLLVPGLVALASLCVALPVAVREPVGPWKAIVRSLDLTRGDRGAVFVALGIVLVVTFAANLLCAGAMGLLSLPVGEDAAGAAIFFMFELLLSLPAIAAAVAYDALRAAKEAPRAAELEQVFE